MNPKKQKKSPLRFSQPVDEEIDLHGLAIDEALVQVELAIERYRRNPKASLRIIHGHSSGNKDSIKGAIRCNLETQWRGRIQSFRPELGNAGATLIYLGSS